jgi:hypothetical protein
MSKDDRSPNWAKWKHIPDLMLWQAVALSLNVDPDKADRGHSWRAEGQEFKNRLEVLQAQVRNSRIKVSTLSISDPEEHRVPAADLSTWALSIGWKIPAELKKLSFHAEAQATDDELRSWGRRELWTLLEAAYLVAGEIPPTAPRQTIKYTATRLTDEDVQRENLGGRSARIYRELKDATDLRRLDFIRPRTGSTGNRRVEPPKCLAWALQRGFEIPASFTGLTTPEKKQLDRAALQDRELTTRERTTLLVLIAALATELKIDLGHPSKAGETISKMTERLGASVSARTIENHIRAASEAVDRRLK